MPIFMHYFMEIQVIQHDFFHPMLGRVCAWQVVCIYWSWGLLFFAVWRNTVFFVRVQRKIVWRLRKRRSIAMRQRQLCRWYIRLNKCWCFLHGHKILNREHHTEITVGTLIARHHTNRGHSKRYSTSISIHPRIEFEWTRIYHTSGDY